MSMNGQTAQELCRICADICQAFGDEFAQHEYEHCKECAETCCKCSEECRSMAGATA